MSHISGISLKEIEYLLTCISHNQEDPSYNSLAQRLLQAKDRESKKEDVAVYWFFNPQNYSTSISKLVKIPADIKEKSIEEVVYQQPDPKMVNTRIVHALRRVNCQIIQDLLDKTPSDIMWIRNFGEQSQKQFAALLWSIQEK